MTAAVKPIGRLKATEDFKRIQSKGKRVRSRCLALTYLSNGTDDIRLGISVSIRTAKAAVRRNRLKRVVRERFRAITPKIAPGYDYVIAIIVDPGQGEGDTIRDELDGLLTETRLMWDGK